MTDVAIRVRGIGKRYEIGERGYGYKTLRESLAGAIRNPFRARKNGHNSNGQAAERTFWALKDINFDVQRGEIVGIIGRNGAGKSTLLKILSRITDPSEGEVEIDGRVGSLLEVGTGFHPELTGRENIFLNGAILGMKRAEIAARFDEIVAFAGTEKFLDTPVKYYSSGMYVRLAFGVAAHLEPEILIVDEVLSVGDAEFQKKCLGKMGDVAHSGRTVLFVSHNLAAVHSLCQRAMVLNHGVVEFDGRAPDAVVRYQSQFMNTTDDSDLTGCPRKGNGKARFTSISIQPLDSHGQPSRFAFPGCDLSVSVEVKCEYEFASANLAVIFYDSNGYRVIDTNTAQKSEFVSMQRGQVARATFLLREVLLKPGKYLLGLWLGRPFVEVLDDVEYAASVDFIEGEDASRHPERFPGLYLCRFEHSVEILQNELRSVGA